MHLRVKFQWKQVSYLVVIIILTVLYFWFCEYLDDWLRNLPDVNLTFGTEKLILNQIFLVLEIKLYVTLRRIKRLKVFSIIHGEKRIIYNPFIVEWMESYTVIRVMTIKFVNITEIYIYICLKNVISGTNDILDIEILFFV